MDLTRNLLSGGNSSCALSERDCERILSKCDIMWGNSVFSIVIILQENFNPIICCPAETHLVPSVLIVKEFFQSAIPRSYIFRLKMMNKALEFLFYSKESEPTPLTEIKKVLDGFLDADLDKDTIRISIKEVFPDAKITTTARVVYVRDLQPTTAEMKLGKIDVYLGVGTHMEYLHIGETLFNDGSKMVFDDSQEEFKKLKLVGVKQFAFGLVQDKLVGMMEPVLMGYNFTFAATITVVPFLRESTLVLKAGHMMGPLAGGTMVIVSPRGLFFAIWTLQSQQD